MFQYHTFSHHSQTCRNVLYRLKNFSTIRFYIILKHSSGMFHSPMRFSTIRFYIILKPSQHQWGIAFVSVPYVFTSFSNCSVNGSRGCIVSVPYVFTSFSNSFQQFESIDSSFSTIRFYIILKLPSQQCLPPRCFSTIRFYIILKHFSLHQMPY